jgi:TusE/DsrC/DsvC family sulfur relay protein
MSTARLQLPGGASLPVDEKGYLLDWRAWTPAVAETMAAADGLELGDDHWQVLRLFREYFEQVRDRTADARPGQAGRRAAGP